MSISAPPTTAPRCSRSALARVTDAVDELVAVYLRERQPGERFLDTYRRTGLAPFKEAVYAEAH